MPGILPWSFFRRSLAISLLERSRWMAGESVRLIRAVALALPRIPEGMTVTTDETASGTSG